MSKIPFNKSQETKHPVIKEYEDLLSNSNIPREEWDKQFLEFYNKNLDFIDDLDNANNDFSITRIIGMKVVFSRILNQKEEYKQGLEVSKHLQLLLDKLNSDAFNYEETYLNAKKWIGLSLEKNKKYVASSKAFKEIVELDKNKESHRRRLIRSYKRPLSRLLLVVNSVLFVIAMIHVLFYPLPFPLAILVAFLFLVSLGVSLNLEKAITYFVNKKYK